MYETKITYRNAFAAEEGLVCGSFDYKNQEAYIAGWLSGEEKFINAVAFEPPTLKYIDESGNEITYKNHLADLHTITGMGCIKPEAFEGQPEHLYLDIAEDPNQIQGKGTIRSLAKIVNFGIIFQQSARTMAENNFISADLAKDWIKKHRLTYPKFHEWADQEVYYARVRGWAANDYTLRMRMVNEDNAKAAGADAGRSGLNQKIQSIGADTGKLACTYVEDEVCDHYPKVELCSFIHDEIFATFPGRCILNEQATEVATIKNNGILTPIYTWDEEAEFYARLIVRQMERAQHHVFKGELPGMVGTPAIAPYWMH